MLLPLTLCLVSQSSVLISAENREAQVEKLLEVWGSLPTAPRLRRPNRLRFEAKLFLHLSLQSPTFNLDHIYTHCLQHRTSNVWPVTCNLFVDPSAFCFWTAAPQPSTTYCPNKPYRCIKDVKNDRRKLRLPLVRLLRSEANHFEQPHSHSLSMSISFGVRWASRLFATNGFLG